MNSWTWIGSNGVKLRLCLWNMVAETTQYYSDCLWSKGNRKMWVVVYKHMQMQEKLVESSYKLFKNFYGSSTGYQRPYIFRSLNIFATQLIGRIFFSFLYILTSSFHFCAIFPESLAFDFNLPGKQYLVSILQTANAWYQKHTILYISFGADMISVNTLCVGRPLLRPFQVADAEVTLERQYTFRNIWKCWLHSTVTVNTLKPR